MSENEPSDMRCDREHIVQLNSRQVDALRVWLRSPNGCHCPLDRVTFEAVENGGLLVRTQPYTYKP